MATTALQVIGSDSNAAFQFIETMGDAFAKGGVPGCNSPGQGRAIAMTCLLDGISWRNWIRTYHMIDGMPSMRSDAMLAELRKLGGKHKVICRTPEKAEIEITFDGQTERFSFTWKDAQQERYVYKKDGRTPKDNWATSRGRMKMLWWRVVDDGVATLAPEVSAGVTGAELFVPEEYESSYSNGHAGNNGHSSPPQVDVVDVEPEAHEAENPFGKPQPRAEDDVVDVPFETSGGDASSSPQGSEKPADPVGEEKSPPADASAEIKAEVKALVGENESIRDYAQSILKQMGIGAVAGLSQLQAKHLAIALYVRILKFEDKLPGSLEKAGVKKVTELSDEGCDKFLASLRKHANTAGK